MSNYRHNRGPNLHDWSQAHWLNLLPPLSGLDVLKLGTKRADNLKSIFNSNPRSISLIGEKTDGMNGYPVTVYDTLDGIVDGLYDLIILDEVEYLASIWTKRYVRSLLTKVYDHLKADGSLFICFPADFWKHLWIKGALTSIGFREVNHYLCTPSSEYPLTIIPFSENPSWATDYICGSYQTENGQIFSIFKAFVKRTLFRLTRVNSPLWGVLAIARKETDNISPKGINLSARIRQVMGQISGNGANIAMVYSTKRYDAKQVVLIFNSSNSEMMAVGKVCREKMFGSERIAQECENTRIVSSMRDLFERRRIIVPNLLHSEVFDKTTLFIESVLKGIPLIHVVGQTFAKDDRVNLMKFVKSIVEIQGFIQAEISRLHQYKIRVIGKEYFQNYMGVPDDLLNETVWNLSDRKQVQHGDFTGVNIFLDDMNGTWGVIDWAGLGAGYPPLFDLFSLLRSLGYRERQDASQNEFQRYFDSFVDSFFRDNWFTRFEAGLVESYCRSYGVDYKNIFIYFLGYLLFQCNKYRLDYNLPEFQGNYEQMLEYSVRNRSRFALWKSNA